MNPEKMRKLCLVLIRLLSFLLLSFSLFITVGCDTRDWYLWQCERLSFDPFNIILLLYQLTLILAVIKPDLPIWIKLIPVIVFYILGYYLIRGSLCEEIHNAMFYFCAILFAIYLVVNVGAVGDKFSK